MHVLLSPKETSALLSVLRPDTTFEGAAQQFSAVFAADRSFRACCGAVLLLEDTALLTSLQRLPLWYILWDVFKTRALAANPFISYLVKAATDESLNPYERCLLVVLLQTGSLNAVSAQTPQGFLAAADVRQLAAAAPDKAELIKVYLAGAPSTDGFSAFKTAALRRSLPDPAAPSAAPSTSDPTAHQYGEQQQLPLTQQLASRLSLRGFEPPWQRPVPAVLTPLPGELKWLALDLPAELLWDSNMGTDPSNAQVVRDLVSKALRGPLLPAQQQQVLSLLAGDPKLVHHIGLCPAQLPALVEFTPVIAYELLLKLMPSRRIGEYFQVLASMEMSLHSMEVVNRLTTAVELPTEFVHLYITNCINSCEGIQDKYMQNRLVRLVCVFLQSLIRNKIINIQDLLHEVQAFCINFSRIREAAGLFRLLKQLEAGGKGLEGMAGAGSDGAGFGHGDVGGVDGSIGRGHREGSNAAAAAVGRADLR